jgi:hypothetical protein
MSHPRDKVSNVCSPRRRGGSMYVNNARALPDYELLRGGSDLLDVALLAARGSAVARRLAAHESLDADDERSLAAVVQLLEASSASVKSFRPESATAPPSGALAARADVAIEAILQDADPSTNVESLSGMLDDLALRVRGLIEDPSATAAASLVDVLGGLAESVLRETGHIGETTSTL